MGSLALSRVAAQDPAPTITDEVTPVVGSIGFRTKSDTVAYFDSVAVEYKPIIPGAQQMVDKFVAEQTKLLGLRIYTAETNGTTRVIASKDTGRCSNPTVMTAVKAALGNYADLLWPGFHDSFRD